MNKTQPISCLGKVAFYDEKIAEKKAKSASKKYKSKYKVYQCPWCTKNNLNTTYHLATIKHKDTKKNPMTYLEYYRKPIVVKLKKPNFFIRLKRAIKHAYSSFVFHIK